MKLARLDIAEQIQSSSRPVSIIPIAASVVDGLLKIKYYQPPRDPNFWETNHAQPRRASKTSENFSNFERLKPHPPSPGPSGSNREMSNTHSHPLSLVLTSEEVVDHPTGKPRSPKNKSLRGIKSSSEHLSSQSLSLTVKQEDPEHHESSNLNSIGAWYRTCGNYLTQPDHPQTYF